MRRGKFVLLVYSILLVASLELFFRVLLISKKAQWSLLTEKQELFWKASWVSRRRQSLDVSIYYSFDRFDLTKGWISKPNLRNFPVFNGKFLNTNDKGFRGTVNHEYSRGNRPRIVVLGDSFTFGDEVSDDETYVHYLQEIYPEVEFINLGVHGYGHDQMLILLQEEGVKYGADMIMMGYLHHDNIRNLLSFRDYAKPKFEIHNNKLILTNSPVPLPEKFLEHWNWRSSRLMAVGRLIGWHFLNRGNRYNNAVKKTSSYILDEFVRTSRSVGAIPLIVSLPTPRGIDEAARFIEDYCLENKRVACTSSLFPIFKAAKRSGMPLKKRWHWDPRGNRLIAEGIYRYLRSNKGRFSIFGDLAKADAGHL